ncbi:MAG: glycoside hydrolase family 38, partial [Opitutae bacterium]|nr:glycoside hydrolase family 38 [Opitutae bacterium]
RDHRLRVLLPTGAQSATYLADGAFDVVERPIALPADNHTRRELAVETCAQQTWTAVADGRRGLAVVAPGLMETAVRDLPERTLALTLFRSTRRTVLTDGQPQGQLQGELVFNYWIEPVAGAVDRVHLAECGIQLGAGLRNAQVTTASLAAIGAGPALPPAASFLAVTGGVVTTSVRQREDGLEVRFFNPGAAEVTATCDFRGRPAPALRPLWAQRMNFDGQKLGRPAKVSRGTFSLPVRPKQIITLRFASAPGKP